MTHKHNT